MPVGELARAFVRLSLDNGSALKAETTSAIEQGAAAGAGSPKIRDAGKKSAGNFSSAFGSELNKGLPAYARAGEQAGATFGQRFGSSAGKITSTLAKIGVAAWVGIGVESVRMASQFQAAMTRVQTQAGASSKDVKILSADILGLGGKVQQSPLDLANAMFHLKSVGLDNVKAMQALRAASNLAAVGNSNLEETTNAIAGAWRSGITGAKNFGAAAATVNAIVGAGNMRMADFITAIGTGILPAARTFGVSLSSVGSALALMTDEGIPANVAATRLRMSLSLMAAPSKAASGYLAQIGLTGLQIANTMRGPGGLVAAIGLLKQHLDASGLGLSQQAILLSHAFGGGRSSSAILTLLNNYDVLERKQRQINSSMGKFGPAVAAQAKTASAQWHLLTGTLDTMAIRIGTALLPKLTQFTGWLVRSHVLIPALITIMGVLTTAIIVQAAAWAATPVGMITLGIVALTAAIVELYLHWDTVYQWFKANWKYVAIGVGLVLPEVGLLIAILGLLATHWKSVAGFAVTAWHDISGAAVTAYHAVLTAWNAAFNFLRPAFHVIAVAAKVAWDFIAFTFKFSWDIVTGLFLAGWAVMHPIWNLMATVATWVFKTIIAPVVTWWWNTIMKPILGALLALAKLAFNGTALVAKAAWNLIITGIKFLWTVVSSVFGFIINGAAKAFGWVPGLGGQLKNAATAFNTFRDQVNAALGGINNRTVNVAVSIGAGATGAKGSKATGKTNKAGFAGGGPVAGPGGPTADMIPAWLSNNEFVQPAAAVDYYGGPFMEAVRTMTFPKMAAGGPVQSGVTVRPVLPSKQQINSYVMTHLQSLVNSEAATLLAALGIGGGGGGTGPVASSGAHSGSAAVAQAYARSILGRYGWSAAQMNYLIPLWNQESGWNAYAVNSSSGAYGIPQSLGHGHPYNLGDYIAQIQWGLNYIRGRYGSPQAAWAHEVANNWYAKGGPVRVFDNGGTISEPVWGIGQSGAKYAFAQNGVPETVSPHGKSGPTVAFYGDVHMEDRTSADLVAHKTDWALTRGRF